MNKPSLRDRRRAEAREALYRAQERREQLIASLVRNANTITTLKRRLKHLNYVAVNVISVLPVSVSEGKLLDPVEVKISDDLDDPIPQLAEGCPWSNDEFGGR